VFGERRLGIEATERVWIAAGHATPTNELIVGALHERGIPATVIRPEQAMLLVRPSDVVIGRLDVRPTLDGVEDGLNELRELQRRRASVLNPAAALLACHDKLETAIRLARFGVAQPPTAHVDVGQAPPKLEYPVVLKPRFGSWGRDLLLCESEIQLKVGMRRLRHKGWFRRQGAIVQTLVPPAGYDLRVIVAAGRVVGAIRRVAAPGEWRTNVSLGGSRCPIEPPDDAAVLAVAAAAAVGADIVGVDLLPLPDGRFVALEVNGAVDFTSEYSLPEQDVFDEIAAVAARLASGRATP
jgi:[lysine-biosynthesis-protein LysW]---L-2-aminoadipate ligase